MNRDDLSVNIVLPIVISIVYITRNIMGYFISSYRFLQKVTKECKI